MDWIVELFNSGGTIVAITWLGKEVISGFLKRQDAKKMKKLEFKQYKQQANFDLKYKVYSGVYSKIKELQGVLLTYQNVQSFYMDNEDALYSRNNKRFFNADETEADQFKSVYYSDQYGRVLININHYNGLIDDYHLDLRNYSAINEFLFSDEEALAIKDIIDFSRSVIDKISSSYLESFGEVNARIEDDPERVEELIEGSIDLFDNKLAIFLEKDLIEINNLICKTDNLFRKEFDAQ